MEDTDGYVLIITPTYNRAAFLPASIESALRQDYPLKKLAIIDDGSTDDTRRVCEQYVNKYPEIVSYIYKENAGCASARNVGLNLIDDSIHYVCFLDSDDLMLPGKLSREVNILKMNPDASFCYSDNLLYIEEKQREILTRVAAAGNPDKFAIKHFLTNEAKPGAILYRAGALKQRRFDESFRFNEDSEFLQRIAIEARGVYSPKPGYWVRMHGGSKSRNRIEICKAVKQSNEKILNAYPDFCSSFPGPIKGRMKRVRCDLFIELVLAGRWEEAREHGENLFQRFIVAFQSPAYYRIRQYMRGKASGAYRRLKGLVR